MKIKAVKQILEENKIEVKKQYGQNFLLEEGIISQICDISNINKNVNVIEIGPGLGFLTTELAKRANKVLCYEIDSDMIKILTNKFAETSNVIIKYQDFLKANIDTDIASLLGDLPVIVVANLPYYITTAILLKILEESNKIKTLTTMMQLEVANRICGTPKTKDYNALSVLIQYYTNATLKIKVPSMCFYPEPNVDSAVILIEYKAEIQEKALSESYFKKFNRVIFAQRRKTLINNLKCGFSYDKIFIEKILLEHHLPLTTRAEELSVEQIVKLSNSFYLAQNN